MRFGIKRGSNYRRKKIAKQSLEANAQNVNPMVFLRWLYNLFKSFDAQVFAYCLLKAPIAFYYVSFFQDPVEATHRGENVTVADGGVKMFSCPVDGNPEPEIEWYSEKSGRKISCGRQLEEKESGCYTCVASNTIGTPVSITQCLIVGESVMFVRL